MNLLLIKNYLLNGISLEFYIAFNIFTILGMIFSFLTFKSLDKNKLSKRNLNKKIENKFQNFLYE